LKRRGSKGNRKKEIEQISAASLTFILAKSLVSQKKGGVREKGEYHRGRRVGRKGGKKQKRKGTTETEETKREWGYWLHGG